MQLSIHDALRVMDKLQIQYVRCKHHIRGFLVVKGVRVLAVRCSHGSGDLPGSVPHRFRRSLNLDQHQFEEMRSCRLGRDAYVEILRAKGLLRT